MLIQREALYFHGGGYIVGSRAMLPTAHIEALKERGFIAVSSDYRLSPTISVLDGPVNDSVAAYEWAQNELPKLLERDHGIQVNGRNIVTLGHSCGGGLALLMVSNIPTNWERLVINISYATRLLAPARPRPSLIYLGSNTFVIPSITLRLALNPSLVHPLCPPPNSSSRSLTKSLRQPRRPLRLVPRDSI